MKETGVVRRLDELGRVVIPKEIRKRMKITSGDMVDIFINDNRIILEKYHPLEQDITSINALINSITKSYGVGLILFDTAKVISSTVDNIKQGDLVSNSLIQRIDNLVKRELSNRLNISIVDDIFIDGELYIEKIYANYELYGYICAVSPIITKNHKEAINIIIDYLSYFLNE